LLAFIKMKQILLIIISCLLGQISFAQSDSVYLSIDSKLISEIQIITPYNENGTRENYTHFKYRYWLGETDTVSMIIVENTEIAKSKKKKIEYQKYGACDSIINKIKNSSYYWKMRSNIDKVARQEIGYGNNEFNNLKNSENNRLKDFSEKCRDQFKIDVSKLKDQLLNEIQRIKEGKIDRFNRLRSNPESIDSTSINSFLETFDLCETDLKSLELIILQNSTDFLTSIDKLSDSDFFSFTLKLDDFSEDSNISKMKETLKESEQRSKRKKKIIRKIKKAKG
jgi:hypothetical protein